MTGLANKSQFHMKLSSALEGAVLDNEPDYLLLIDLDGFKKINDEFGHLAGDECIREIGNRLGKTDLSGVSIFRIGGDEFAIITSQICKPEQVNQLAKAIIDSVCDPISYNGINLKLGASVGIAPISGSSAPDVFSNADAALYSAKASGKGVFRFHQR